MVCPGGNWRLSCATGLESLLLSSLLSPPAATPRGSRRKPAQGQTPSCRRRTRTAIPTVHVAQAKGWSGDATPQAADGLAVRAYASGLDHPRWLYVLPNGDVLVAETNAPPRPEDGKGIKGWFMKKVMKRAGARRAQRQPHHAAARRRRRRRRGDAHGFPGGLNSPFGMALVGNDLYVANTDAIVRFPYPTGETQITAPATKVVDLPGGPLNHHWTKNIIASRDGTKLYVTVGSNSNVAENGMEKEERPRRDLGGRPGDAASTACSPPGCAIPNGLAWEPETGALWTVVNERDELGNDLVPDYMTSVQRRRRSTAGRTATTASTSTRA